MSKTYSTTIEITEEKEYSVTINTGLNLSAWITAGSTTGYPLNPSSYADFAALEADEEAIRQLMLVHNAVNYLATAAAGDSLMEDVINSDVCAKWINLSDYALDTLSANSDIKSVMDAADKYGYGEWGAVGRIPVMTSATAPSGNVSTNAGNYTTYYPYLAFQPGSIGWASSAGQAVGNYLRYTFATPTAIKKVNITVGLVANSKFKIQGLSNGSWVDIGEEVTHPTAGAADFTINNGNDDTVYGGVQFIVTSVGAGASGSSCAAKNFQVYTWGPLGNVPIMTSDSAPYGTVRSSGANSGSEAYKAFDGNTSTYFMSSTYDASSNYWVSYKAVNPIKPKKAYVQLYCTEGYASSVKFKIQGSNDGFASDIHDVSSEITCTVGASSVTRPYDPVEVDITTDAYYMEYRIVRTYASTSARFAVITFQFYGRELKPLVPTMTSNTTPYGVASISPSAVSGYDAYKAFDGDLTTGARPNGTAGQDFSIEYDFGQPFNLQCIFARSIRYGSPTADLTAYLQYYDAATSQWIDISTYPYKVSAEYSKFVSGIDATTTKVKLKGTFTLVGGDTLGILLTTLQAYGMDYSEKEFAQGSTRKTIYDHGVKPSGAITQKAIGSGSIALEEPDQLYVSIPTTASTQAIIGGKVNFSGKNYLYAKAGNKFKANSTIGYFASLPSSVTAPAGYVVLSDANSKASLEPSLDVSSVSGENYAVMNSAHSAAGSACEATIKELWLE